MPSSTLQPGRKRRNTATKGIAGANSPVTRKKSTVSQTSDATTKSLSSKTDFSLPSPPGASEKPKLRGSGNNTRDELPNGLSVIYDAGEHSESTSYGSLTLGGAASLSSADTFQNSTIRPKSSSNANGPILKRRDGDKRTDQSQDTLPCSNTGRSSGNGYLPHSIQQFHTYGHSHSSIGDDGNWSSSSSSIEVEPIPVKRSPVTTKRRSAGSKASPRKNSRSPKKNSTKSSPKSQSRNSPSKKHKPRHSGTKSSPNRRTSPKTKNDNGATNGLWGANTILDLSSWQSDDDDESSLDDQAFKEPVANPERVIKKKRQIATNWKSPLLFEEEQEEPSFLQPQTTTLDGKPRSAYDKNADWYCDSEDDKGSVASDNSSVLSAFRPKKRQSQTEVAPQSEASMDFGALLGGPEEGSSEALEAEQSMQFGNLQSSQGKSKIIPISGLFPGLGEESMQSDVESMLDKSAMESYTSRDSKGATEAAPKSSYTRASETETCSPPESAPSLSSTSESSSREARAQNKKSLMKELSSKRVFRFILAGVILFLIVDIILLSIFLARRGTDSSSSSSVLAYVPETVCLDWIPSGGKSEECSAAETSLGGGVPNLVAHAIRSFSADAIDIALIPGGLTHRDISPGDFTEEDATAVFQPIDFLRRMLASNDATATLVQARAVGSELRRLLSENAAAALGQGQESRYPYAAGLRFAVDSVSPSVQIGGIEVEGNEWIELSEEEEYVVITTQDWADSHFNAEVIVLEMTPLSALVDLASGVEALTNPGFSTTKVADSDQFESTRTEDDPITVPNTICLEWLPGGGMSNFCSPEETSKQGGGAGNVVAWSILEYLNSETKYENDMVLVNAGECQTDIVEGTFSENDAKALMPVDQPIVILNVTGQQLATALEQSIDFALQSEQNRGSYPYAGGLRFEVSPLSSSTVSRVSNVEYFSRGRWKAVAPERQFRLATTLALADGKLGYDALYDAVSRVDPDDLFLRQSFLKSLQQRGIIEDVPLDHYSTQNYG